MSFLNHYLKPSTLFELNTGIRLTLSYYSWELWRNSEHVLRITNTVLSIWAFSHNSDKHFKGVVTLWLRNPSNAAPTSASGCGNSNITARTGVGPRHKGDTYVITYALTFWLLSSTFWWNINVSQEIYRVGPRWLCSEAFKRNTCVLSTIACISTSHALNLEKAVHGPIQQGVGRCKALRSSLCYYSGPLLL